ncbi:MAG: hypothetical protein WC054_02740 [Candidatus Nanopelagicales bacterium]
MSEFVTIAAPTTTDPEPFRFELAGEQFELPMLSSETAPLELIPVLMMATNDDVSERETLAAGVAFFEYLRDDHPKLWRHLKKQKQPIVWVNGLMEAWLKASNIDPKASS